MAIIDLSIAKSMFVEGMGREPFAHELQPMTALTIAIGWDYGEGGLIDVWNEYTMEGK